MRRSLVHLAASLVIAVFPAACSAAPAPAEVDPFAVQRDRMVAMQIEARGVRDPVVLAGGAKFNGSIDMDVLSGAGAPPVSPAASESAGSSALSSNETPTSVGVAKRSPV